MTKNYPSKLFLASLHRCAWEFSELAQGLLTLFKFQTQSWRCRVRLRRERALRGSVRRYYVATVVIYHRQRATALAACHAPTRPSRAEGAFGYTYK